MFRSAIGFERHRSHARQTDTVFTFEYNIITYLNMVQLGFESAADKNRVGKVDRHHNIHGLQSSGPSEQGKL